MTVTGEAEYTYWYVSVAGRSRDAGAEPAERGGEPIDGVASPTPIAAPAAEDRD